MGKSEKFWGKLWKILKTAENGRKLRKTQWKFCRKILVFLVKNLEKFWKTQ